MVSGTVPDRIIARLLAVIKQGGAKSGATWRRSHGPEAAPRALAARPFGARSAGHPISMLQSLILAGLAARKGYGEWFDFVVGGR